MSRKTNPEKKYNKIKKENATLFNQNRVLLGALKELENESMGLFILLKDLETEGFIFFHEDIKSEDNVQSEQSKDIQVS